MKGAGLILGVCVLLTLVGSPVGAISEKGPRCDNGIDDDNDGATDCDDSDRGNHSACQVDPGPVDGFSALGAVGHDFSCLPCEVGPVNCVTGDIFDDEVTKGDPSVTFCENLTCGSGNGQNLVCGRQGEGRPRIDISGLYPIWLSDPDAQGEPSSCFGDGIVSAIVHTENSGNGDQIQVLLFFSAGVDESLLPGTCDANDLVKYVAEVSDCTLSDPPGNYPPQVGETTTIECLGVAAQEDAAQVSIGTEGGGRVAKKCGCVASGLLANDTDINFLGQ